MSTTPHTLIKSSVICSFYDTIKKYDGEIIYFEDIANNFNIKNISYKNHFQKNNTYQTKEI